MNFHISVAHLFDTIAKSVYQLYNTVQWCMTLTDMRLTENMGLTEKSANGKIDV